MTKLNQNIAESQSDFLPDIRNTIRVRVLSRISSIIDVANELEKAQRFSQSKGWKNTSLDFAKVQAMHVVLVDAVCEINDYVQDLDRAFLLANKRANVSTNLLEKFIELRSAISQYAAGKITKENLDIHFQNFLDA